MSVQVAVYDAASPQAGTRECRVFERHSCGLEAACQPIAARGDNDVSWAAEIRDLSVGGVGVVLKRRFERGAGLAIEIPETATAPADTLLARVVHTTSLPDGRWLLGCAFVSRLSEDELSRLINLGQDNAENAISTEEPFQEEPAPEELPQNENLGQDNAENAISREEPFQEEPAPEELPRDEPSQDEIGTLDGILIHDVTWRTRRHGQSATRRIKRFHLNGNWPLRRGAIFKVWFGKKSSTKTRVRVLHCYQQNERWFVDYTFLDDPSSELLQSFGLS